jgi:hypothetical protein
MPTQNIPGIEPIVVQAIENLFPNIGDQKYAFNYVLAVKELGRVYRDPRLLLALLSYSNGKIEKLIDPNSQTIRDGRFMIEEILSIFPKMEDAERWVKEGYSWVLPDALQSIHKEFGFMFEQGYEVYSAKDDPNAGWPVWEVILQKQDLFVRLYAERGVLEDLSFRTTAQPPDEFTDIIVVVHALTGKQWVPSISNRTKSYADLLRKHIDKIEAYFGGESVKIRDSIRTAKKEYRQAITPKQEKIIPILHYPLMAMIFLLLAGFLTTLYMVLLDRLFFALSIDADIYRTGIPIVAILLAIGTILVFRRLRA